MTEMCGELILIRHGKAEEREEGKDERLRILTPKGREELQKILPELRARLAPKMEPSLNLRLCASPLPRALQTAEIIAADLDITEIEQYDWIESGAYAGLQDLLNSLAPSATLAVVGHEPYLNDWSWKLCGLDIPFRKGMALGFRVLSKEPLRAAPVWMILPETLSLQSLSAKGGKPAPEVFRTILRYQLQDIFRRLQYFLEKPDDPETAHQLRVKIRAHRSLLSFIRPQMEKKQYQIIRKQMKELFQRTGRLREIDVLIIAWRKYLKAHPKFDGQQSAMLSVLVSERQQEQKEILGNIAERALSVIFDTWSRLHIAFKAQEEPFADFSRKRLGRWEEQAQESIQALDYHDFPAIHALRIQFKKLRYVQSMLNPLLQLESEEEIGRLKSLQDLLGSYCDTKRNISILQELNTRHATPEFGLESGLLSEYQALLSAEKLTEIQNYFGPLHELGDVPTP